MNEKKPALIPFPANQKFCPVCGNVTYSPAGEHPQCSAARGDAVLRARRSKQSQRKQAVAPHRPLAKS